MPGPKPSAQIIFSRIHVELLRLRILCETELQHNVLNNLEAVTLKVMPLWTDQPLVPPSKRSTPRERDQNSFDAEERVRRMYGKTPT